MEPALAQNNTLTKSQQEAVSARGNILVMAGAGTGKTKTLVERCLDCLITDRAALEELLIVTFTEAAAAELRHRLRLELEKRVAAAPSDDHLAEQLARFDLAHIGTLHSFCLKLIREHFYELGLDPQFAILDEVDAHQRAEETLDAQFKAHYESKHTWSPAVHELIRVHGGGHDDRIRQLILRLFHYSQTRPDADGWLAQQRARFAAADPTEWREWLPAALADWCAAWLPAMEDLAPENPKATELAGLLTRLEKNPGRAAAAEILRAIVDADATESYPKRSATKLRPALGKIFEEAAFLASVATVKNERDPLGEDWSWVRGQMETLLRLAQEFTQLFSDQKRNDGVVDFHDLEQLTLELLTKTPAVAREWQQRLRFVFVDEYQDINAAQDRIIAALAREGAEANRFLVGDVKQSIYRFRLADPKIFRDYAKTWRASAGQTIPLADNFRSREGLIGFVNSICRLVMREAAGGVEYDTDAELKFGTPENRAEFSIAPDTAPRVELLLRLKSGRNTTREDDEEDDLADLDETQKEARLTGLHLKRLVTEKHVIWDDRAKISRPVEWRDMAILLRSMRGKSDIFVREFERLHIPLAVSRGGFYESAEILDLISLLKLLDNPLQDVPCIAVLRSPLVGLSLDELAEIRLGLKEGHFWTALNRSQDPAVRRENETSHKVARFLERYSRWRKLARQSSLSECLEAVLAETYYSEWLRAQPRGGQRAANITSFLGLVRQFDRFQRQGLLRFLKFIAAQADAGANPEVPAEAAENAVRLMSIHQSKGLEFPVVVLADLAKTFNELDLRGDIIFDEMYGLCPKIKPPFSGRRYPSLAHWLARRRQKGELLGEELRLLYVALTRARDNLILTASLSEKSWGETWRKPAPVKLRQLTSARSFADWLALWFRNQSGGNISPATGEFALLRWRLAADEELKTPATTPAAAKNDSPAADAAALQRLQDMLAWNYSHDPATRRKAKSSVTALRHEAEELDDEAEPLIPPQVFNAPSPRRKTSAAVDGSKRKLSASETGAAHHKFLQHVDLARLDDLAAEADRLVRDNYLTAEEGVALDLKALAAFWNSALGKKIRAHTAAIRRELPFTARFTPAEIATVTGAKAEDLDGEFIVVQGVADLVVLLEKEIWLVDFKTDELRRGELPEKIRLYTPQLKLYAAALKKTFRRPIKLSALHFLAVGKTEMV